jgi:hypothetical protein
VTVSIAQLDELLNTPPPRQVPGNILRRASRRWPPLPCMLVATFLLACALFLCYSVCLPWLRDVALFAGAETRLVQGTITDGSYVCGGHGTASRGTSRAWYRIDYTYEVDGRTYAGWSYSAAHAESTTSWTGPPSRSWRATVITGPTAPCCTWRYAWR